MKTFIFLLVPFLKRAPCFIHCEGKAAKGGGVLISIMTPSGNAHCNVLPMTNLTGQQVDNIIITVQFVVNCIALSSSLRGKPFSRFQVLTDLASYLVIWYTGSTTKKFRLRFNNHKARFRAHSRLSFEGKNKDDLLYRHFSGPGHHGFDDVSI